MKTGPRPIPIEKRFWKYVVKTPKCWIWTGGKAGKGYGVTTTHINGKKVQVYAHRISYEMANGPIINDLYILHECDEPSCVKPSHLKVGTQKDNMLDATNKGRVHKGEKHWNAILSEKQVVEIRHVYERGTRGHGYISLGKTYGVSSATIERIIKKKIWAHVN